MISDGSELPGKKDRMFNDHIRFSNVLPIVRINQAVIPVWTKKVPALEICNLLDTIIMFSGESHIYLNADTVQQFPWFIY